MCSCVLKSYTSHIHYVAGTWPNRCPGRHSHAVFVLATSKWLTLTEEMRVAEMPEGISVCSSRVASDLLRGHWPVWWFNSRTQDENMEELLKLHFMTSFSTDWSLLHSVYVGRGVRPRGQNRLCEDHRLCAWMCPSCCFTCATLCDTTSSIYSAS